jgi:hypothetical protein
MSTYCGSNKAGKSSQDIITRSQVSFVIIGPTSYDLLTCIAKSYICHLLPQLLLNNPTLLQVKGEGFASRPISGERFPETKPLSTLPNPASFRLRRKKALLL